MVSENNKNLQEEFLNYIRKNKTPVTVFLVKGVKLQGVVTWFDSFSMLPRRDGYSQLVYKHAISTVMPTVPFSLFDVQAQGRSRQGSQRSLMIETDGETLALPARVPCPAGFLTRPPWIRVRPVIAFGGGVATAGDMKL